MSPYWRFNFGDFAACIYKSIRTICLIAICGFLLNPAELAQARNKGKRHLIEFGWDIPDSAFMREHIRTMEKTPFEGCVFQLRYRAEKGSTGDFSWEVWGRHSFTEEELRQSVDDLKAIRFHRFHHNFLRFNVTPGDVDWFDDFSAVVSNAKMAARIARIGKAKGILLDVEQYKLPIFSYQKQKYATSKGWTAYAAQVRLRGRQIMSAFQERFPGITVFLTYGYTLPWEQSHRGLRPLSDTDYGLLAPFLDGMLDAAAGRSRIIDGYEFAYSFKDSSRFSAAYRDMTVNVLGLVANPSRYRKFFSFSFGIWLDLNWRELGWDPNEVMKNPHSPRQFEGIVEAAVRSSDEYVWIYSETPKWWSAPDGASQLLPEAYQAALINASRVQGNH